LVVPPGSIMLCVGFGSISDDLATELLVRILRDQKIDARHMTLDELKGPPPPGAAAGIVSVVYLVSAFPSGELEQADSVADTIRRRLPQARLVTLFLPGMLLQPGASVDSVRDADHAATSFGQALQICLAMQSETAGAREPVDA
jgi:hypothetical protein